MSAPAMGLTPKMRWALLVMQEWIAERGVPPTRKELAWELQLCSTSETQRLVRALVERGRIAVRPGAVRGLAVLAPLPLPEDVEFAGFFEDAAKLKEALG